MIFLTQLKEEIIG